MAKTLRLPGQPPMLDGFLNLRGTLVPVVLLRQLFDLPEASFEMYTPVIIVKVLDTVLGLCADHVIEVEQIDETNLRPVSPDYSFNDCAEAEFMSGEHRCILLNLDRLLLQEERKRLDELSQETHRRLAAIEASRG